jgi:hemerythrin
MIAWSDDLTLGIPRIDFEHKILFEMLADFEKAQLRGASEDVLRDSLAEIAAFTKYLFMCEEHLLTRIGYPDFYRHRDQHFEFMDILFNITFSGKMSRARFPQAVGCLSKWFIEHIREEDAKYASFTHALTPLVRTGARVAIDM